MYTRIYTYIYIYIYIYTYFAQALALQSHIRNGSPVLIWRSESLQSNAYSSSEVGFFTDTARTALNRCASLNPSVNKSVHLCCGLARPRNKGDGMLC